MYYGYIGNAHANMQSSVISIFTPPCPTKDEAERAFDVYFNELPKQLKIEAHGIVKYLVTRKTLCYTEIEANSEEDALEKAGLVLEADWHDNDRPEYSLDLAENYKCDRCALVKCCPGYYVGCFEAVNQPLHG